MDFLLLIKFDHVNNMSLITLLFKTCQWNPNPGKGCILLTVYMLTSALMFQNFEKNVKSCSIGLQLYYKLIPVF